ncbi:tyrosine-type recombinase/integrase [Xanthobacter oligotrophicus]|uniref:Tyrosine-type recombinase/integrase n=1 Tax=Xanthobacter oligotrophicus TaxID=2607286 RepID=A0ABW6ZWE8_9HYPH
MARSTTTDRRWLELKDGKWRVTVAVPRKLHGKLGTRLKRPLNTDSLAVANRLKWPVVAEFKRQIEEAGGTKGKDPLLDEALALAAYRRTVDNPAELALLADTVAERAHEIAGQPVSEERDPDTGEPVPVYDRKREGRARQYADIAAGRATPLDAHHAAYMAQQHTKARTQADDMRAIGFLKEWCEKERVPPVVEAITRRQATRFADGLGAVAGGRGAVTLNKYLGRLSRYWQWMEHREHVAANVWHGIKIAPPPTPHDELERAFTNDEMVALLSGPATPAMHDLMRIAALTGARLDAIVDLKVGDCADDLFVFKPQKKEPAPRAVPIHPALRAIVKRRTAGKKPEDDLFPEWPAPRKVGSLRERSFKASNAFTAYRREVGVDAVIPGKRRSLVNFHSFRRWFITQAERADVPESIIAVVVGHKREGMTLGRYSAGPLQEQARRCVEAVRLPEKAKR